MQNIRIGGHYVKGKREVVVIGFDCYCPNDVIFQEVGRKQRTKVTKAIFRRVWKLKAEV